MQSAPWRIAVLPDTQIYARAYPELFVEEVRWIAENAHARNIRLVVHVGDVVDDNGPEQWAVASKAIHQLDGEVPYILALGNHDYGEGGSSGMRDTLLHEYFPRAQIAASSTFGGTFDPERADNIYRVIETGSGPWLAIALEFAPRDAVVAWARGVLEAHASMPALLATHSYMYSDNTRYDIVTRPDQLWSPHLYWLSDHEGGLNDGEALYQKLVAPCSNVRLVFSGHVLNTGVGKLTSVRADGTTVHQMLANYQHTSRGGDGYFRLLTFDADARTIHVQTYSPVLDSYKTDPDNDFVLEL